MVRQGRRRRISLFTTAAVWFYLLTQIGSVSGRQADTTKAVPSDSSFFPVAVWYGGGKARAPMLERLDSTSSERWGKDLDAIKATGFNTIKTWVDWATAEPRAGEFSFANLDLLLRLAQERGLRVIIQLYLDSAPDWIGRRYPDAHFVDRSGAVIQSQSAPGYCIDHEMVRREVVKFLQALSTEANRSPALYGWDVWSEPHVINWADFSYLTNPEFCYCAYTKARFRRWLQAKYQSLDALNAAWYRNFDNWDQVDPPRFSTILSYTDYLDWRAFIDDKLAGDLKTRVDAIRSADHAHPITSHAAVPGLFTSPMDGYGEPDDWKMSETADFFGTSLYPKHSESQHPWSYEMLAAGLDFTRSAGHSFGKGFWIGELQAGQGATGMRIGEPVNPQDEQFWMWQVVSHGAREIAVYAWYPMSSGYESNGYGLINLDGTITDRARAAGNVARTIEQHSEDFLRAKPTPAQVAILYNRLSYMVGGTENSLSKLGNAERDSLLGLYSAFMEEQIPVDFVHTDDLIHDRLGQYKILFVPFPVMFSKDAAAGLRRYVNGGGTAVAEARLAWNDERGFASDVIPGFGLSELFDAREKLIRPVDKPEILLEKSPGLPDLAAGSSMEGEAFEEELEPLAGAQVLGHFADGAAAVVEKSNGKGRAILVGSFLGLAYQRQHADPVKQFVVSLAKHAGVEREVQVAGPGMPELEIRRLVGENQETLFVFNHSDKSLSPSISLPVRWPISEIRDLTSDTPVAFQQGEDRVSFHKALVGGESLVLRIQGGLKPQGNARVIRR
jgi:beta-galactosidase